MRNPSRCAIVLLALALAACKTPGGGTTSAPLPTNADSTKTEVAEGAKAPAFSRTAHDGTKIGTSEQAGKSLVLYFYPRDNTPGCTREAIGFRDQFEELRKSAVVVGVSEDENGSHSDFARQHNLPFPLIADTDGSLAGLFGVPTLGGFAARQTIVIGPDGTIRKIFRSVDPSVHAKQILEVVQTKAP